MPFFSSFSTKASYEYSSTYDIYFNHPSFSPITIENTSYVSVSISDCMLTSEPGAAQLPFYAAHILIPDGCHIKTIHITEDNFIDYSDIIKDNEVVFAEEETPFGSPLNTSASQKNQSWYEANMFQPSQSYKSLGVSYMKGYPVKTIHVYPMRYHPKDNLLWFHQKLSITVTYSYVESSLSSTTNQFFRKQDTDAARVKELVLNPDLVDTYPLDQIPLDGGDEGHVSDDQLEQDLLTDSYSGGLCNASDQVSYVIVTSDTLTQPSAEPYNWSDLIQHREQRNGLSGEIVTMEEILACTDYYNDTDCFNDSAARLREFCKDAYLDWNTEYLLLGGGWVVGDENKQLVPCRIFTDVDETGGVDTMPSDLYFSNLDGDWYYQENIWGGGRGGANDKLSELAVGRIPVWNTSMVSNAVEKIIWYDTTDDESFLRSAAFLGGDLGWTSTSEQYMEELRVGDGSFSQFEGFEEWNTAFQEYQIDTSACYYDADYPTENEAINAWKNAINNNECCLINHLDHGAATNTLSLGDGSGLSNDHFFLGTSQACSSGRYINGESGASSFLGEYNDRGAFAMVLNTGYGYGSATSTAGKSQLQHKIFWDYFFANQTTDFSNWQLGLAMQYTKDMFSSYIDSLSSHVYAYVWYSWNLFGDPAQCIRMNVNDNTAPSISNGNPEDTAVDVAWNLSEIAVLLSDVDGDLITWSIETSPNVGNCSGINQTCGEKTCSLNELEYFTTYTWFVNVTDGIVWTNQTFTFTSEVDPTDRLPLLSQPVPVNNSTQVDVFRNNISITVEDPDGDMLTTTLQGACVDNKIVTNHGNSTVNASLLTPLPYNTTITWFVNVSDHRYYPVTAYYEFTTRNKYFPSAPTTVNCSAVNRTSVSLNWTKNTSADGTIIERHTISTWNHSEGIEIYNGSASETIDNTVLPGLTYYYQIWGYNTTDMIVSNTSILKQVSTPENQMVNITHPTPGNQSINCSVNLTFSVNLTDDDGDRFNWSIEVNETLKAHNTSVGNGTKSVQLTNLSYYTEYIVWVNASDGFNQTSAWFQFRTTLPNDTIPPQINSIQFSTVEHLSDQQQYGWNQLQCSITDNFRVASVSINITDEHNSSTNHSLTQIDDSTTWNLTLDEPIFNPRSVRLFATDYNGNTNQTLLTVPSPTLSVTFEENHEPIEYSHLPIDITSIDCIIITSNNQSFDYTFSSSPLIGSKQGNISDNETIQVSLSGVSYETPYECVFSFKSNRSWCNLTIYFTTEDEPKQSQQFSNPPSPGADFPPANSGPEEEEQNLPPEIPLPPSGPVECYIEENVTVTVVSWDRNQDEIYYQIDWGDQNRSNWSAKVPSNTTISFFHQFNQSGTFEIRVRAKDEQGLISNWSESLLITAQKQESSDQENAGVVAHVNNRTGETQFQYAIDTSEQNYSSIVWDFGDGVILEGVSPVHRYSTPGTYTVTVTVVDEHGNTSMKTLTVMIPEPQKEVDTPIASSDKTSQGFPWIFVLIGILFACIAAIIISKK